MRLSAMPLCPASWCSNAEACIQGRGEHVHLKEAERLLYEVHNPQVHRPFLGEDPTLDRKSAIRFS